MAPPRQGPEDPRPGPQGDRRRGHRLHRGQAGGGGGHGRRGRPGHPHRQPDRGPPEGPAPGGPHPTRGRHLPGGRRRGPGGPGRRRGGVRHHHPRAGGGQRGDGPVRGGAGGPRWWSWPGRSPPIPTCASGGVQCWEAHVITIKDPVEKEAAVAACITKLTDSAELCRRAGLGVEIVSCGGSSDYYYSARQPGVTEVEAGGAVFMDVFYETRGVRPRLRPDGHVHGGEPPDARRASSPTRGRRPCPGTRPCPAPGR